MLVAFLWKREIQEYMARIDRWETARGDYGLS